MAWSVVKAQSVDWGCPAARARLGTPVELAITIAMPTADLKAAVTKSVPSQLDPRSRVPFDMMRPPRVLLDDAPTQCGLACGPYITQLRVGASLSSQPESSESCDIMIIM
ncbi:MAG: hypothetical protein CL484_15800 [Acidobacteria bacterium]|nr:hypothetical protein [Acidobacteriota bacterium]